MKQKVIGVATLISVALLLSFGNFACHTFRSVEASDVPKVDEILSTPPGVRCFIITIPGNTDRKASCIKD